MKQTAIIIPCYNEAKRLKVENINTLLTETDATVFLANDGSTDTTLQLANRIAVANPERIKVIHFDKNEGKGKVVYKAVKKVLADNKYDYISYYDADFSTPTSELTKMIADIKQNNINFIFASRLKRLNSTIERSTFRHYIGRIITTIVNFKFHLAIYDTQCGAKILSKEAVKVAFEKPFYTKWLFDVEIFIRLRKQKLLHQSKEFFLAEWKDISGSKLRWTDGFKIMREIVSLYLKY